MTHDEKVALLKDRRPSTKRARCTLALDELLEPKRREALSRYNRYFDPKTYNRATRGRSVTYANALIDEALAICGHPSFKVHRNRLWSVAALEHLARFAPYTA